MARKSKRAVEDGKLIRRKAGGQFVMAPDEVVALIKKHVRQVFGDEVENKYAEIYATRGFFHVMVNPPPRLAGKLGKGAFIRDSYWREAIKTGLNVRRFQIGLVLRAIHGEVLT